MPERVWLTFSWWQDLFNNSRKAGNLSEAGCGNYQALHISRSQPSDREEEHDVTRDACLGCQNRHSHSIISFAFALKRILIHFAAFPIQSSNWDPFLTPSLPSKCAPLFCPDCIFHIHVLNVCSLLTSSCYRPYPPIHVRSSLFSGRWLGGAKQTHISESSHLHIPSHHFTLPKRGKEFGRGKTYINILGQQLIANPIFLQDVVVHATGRQNGSTQETKESVVGC